MIKYTFLSKLAIYLENFIDEKHVHGYIYDYEAYILERFDRFIINNNFDNGVISKELVDQWSIQKESESNNYRNQRVSFVRQFAKYLSSLGLYAYIPKPNHDNPPPSPYILSIQELQQFLAQVDNYKPIHHRYEHQSALYSVIFRLYICCGLRLNEPLTLKIDDVNLDQGILHILHSKGNKDRNVFMSDDLGMMCKKYDKMVSAVFPKRSFFLYQ